MKKLLVLLLGVMALSFAIAEAGTITAGDPGKYTVTQGSYTTEGGNVTEVNVTSDISTEKWAGFWGEITGGLRLAPNATAIFYSWSWSPAAGGEICAVGASSGFDWSSVTTVSAATIDSVWGFATSDTDSATKTFNVSDCTLTINNRTITNTVRADTNGAFQTCAVGDGDNTAKSDVAFCVAIANNNALFNGRTGDYEMIVATGQGPTDTETYYFWLELN